MPRSRGEKSIEAEKLYHTGEKLVDIAKRLGVPEGTVRRWKSDQDWDGQKKQTERSVSRSDSKPSVRKKANATIPADAEASQALQVTTTGEDSKTNSNKPVGAPVGNKNAVGNKGGPGAPKENQNALIHGLYAQVFETRLSEEERQVFYDTFDDNAQELIRSINISKIRVMRLWDALDNLQAGTSSSSGLKVDTVTSTKNKREFEGAEEEAQYRERINEKVAANERLPGNNVEVSTTMVDASDLALRYHAEIGRTQRDISRKLEQLNNMRIADRKLNMERRRLLLDWAKFSFKKQYTVHGIDLDTVYADDDPDLELDRQLLEGSM